MDYTHKIEKKEGHGSKNEKMEAGTKKRRGNANLGKQSPHRCMVRQPEKPNGMKPRGCG